jgi:hypothetical protein
MLSDPAVCGRKVYQEPQSVKDFHYNTGTVPQWNVWEWIEKLKNGCTSVMHEEGAGRPSMSTDEDNIERACDMVLLERRTVDMNDIWIWALEVYFGSFIRTHAFAHTHTVKLVQSAITRDRIYFPHWPSVRIIQIASACMRVCVCGVTNVICRTTMSLRQWKLNKWELRRHVTIVGAPFTSPFSSEADHVVHRVLYSYNNFRMGQVPLGLLYKLKTCIYLFFLHDQKCLKAMWIVASISWQAKATSRHMIVAV